MNVARRIRTCRVIEKMARQENFSRKVGLINESTFQGKKVSHSEKPKTIENESDTF